MHCRNGIVALQNDKNELMNKDPYVFSEQAPPIILDSKVDVCMANNGKYNKHTIHIYSRMQFVIHGEELNLHKKV